MKNNILNLIGDFFSLKPAHVSIAKGGEYHCPCPGCGGKDRFHIWPEQNNGEGSYWCRGCGKGGDAISFLREFTVMNFKEAALRVGRNIQQLQTSRRPFVPHEQKKTPWKPETKERPSNVKTPKTWEEHAGKFVKHCHDALMVSRQHLEWLNDRGISKDAAAKWKVGLHKTPGMEPSFRPRVSWGFSGGVNPKTGRQYVFILPAGIVIPWFDKTGKMKRIRIRLERLDLCNPQKKYHAVAGSIMETFITRLDAPVYVVVETELDAIMLDSVAGDLIGVIAVGSSHAKPTGSAGTSILRAKKIINALDYDTAGANAGTWWAENIPQTIRRPVPIGKDPGDFFKTTGPEQVREWIVNGLPAAYRIGLKVPQKAQSKKFADTLDGGQMPCCEARPEPPLAHHPKVLHLRDLLEKCPVAIKKTDTYYGLHKLAGYNKKVHFESSSKISKIIFTEPAISYLHELPEKFITFHNIIPKGGP